MAKRDTTAKTPSRKAVKAAADQATGAAEMPSVTLASDGATGAKPAKAAHAKTAAAKVFTITDIGDHLAATFDMPKSHAKIYLAEAVALIGKQLKKGAKVRLSGLGTLQVKKRAARKARNPNTGEEVKVKAGKRVVFAASQDLKDKL